MKKEKYEKALKNFIQAERIYPNSSFIQTYIGMALMNHKQNDLTLALERFERAQKMNSESPLNSFMMIQALTNLDRDEDALMMVTNLINKHPKETSLYIHREKLMKKLGRNEEALNDYNKAFGFG